MRAQAAAVMAEVDRLGQVDEACSLRVTGVRFVPLSYQFPAGDEQRWSGGILPGVTAGVIEVTTDDGIVGYGETYAATFAPTVVGAIIAHLEPLLIGSPAGEITRTWQRCWSRHLYWARSGALVATLSGIEMALWDVCGRALGRPVYDLLGATGRTDIACYASGGMQKPPASLRAEQAGYVAAGFGGSKIRGGHDAGHDAEVAATARDAVGPSFPLAVDAVQGSNPQPWTQREAIAAGRALAQYDLLWLEEPCGALDIEGYVACRRVLPMPIAGGETLTTALEFLPFFEAGAFDIVQPDAAHTGGIGEALKVARLAELYGVRTAMHVWGSGICVRGNAHVAFAAESCDWLEYPTIPNPLIAALQQQPLTPHGGRVSRPVEPGLGVMMPPSAVADYQFTAGNAYRFARARGADG
ncbi:MAG: mandelate racemase/muconate lactonizing enzyme family protein [Actinomycetales bacterium]|nr:mandelate racemase/muconate lactonizing enzyme family protein [Actinomycetales bacterium]